MLTMFIIIDIYSLHYDIMKRHICQCVCPVYSTRNTQNPNYLLSIRCRHKYFLQFVAKKGQSAKMMPSGAISMILRFKGIPSGAHQTKFWRAVLASKIRRREEDPAGKCQFRLMSGALKCNNHSWNNVRLQGAYTCGSIEAGSWLWCWFLLSLQPERCSCRAGRRSRFLNGCFRSASSRAQYRTLP